MHSRARHRITLLPSPLLRLVAVVIAVALAAAYSLTAGLLGSDAAHAAGGSVLSNETFSGASVPDPRWTPLGDACLTAAPAGSAAPAGGSALGGCRHGVDSPDLGSGSDGYLQLTDNSGGRTGAAVYDRAFPATAGLQLSFYEYQYAVSGTGLGAADGIGFFLTDGSYTLTKPGPQGSDFGGALGYASIGSQPGVAHGYLGVGLDTWGNFEAQPYVGTSCPTANGNLPQGNSVGLRGPGDGTDGYCLIDSVRYPNLRNAPATAPGGATGTPQQVTVTVSPTTAGDPYPTITVAINGTTVLTRTMTTPAPPTMKLGFAASTGGGHAVHLIRQVAVSTVNPLGAISIVKTVDHSDATGTPQTIFTQGDTVPYSFLVTNTGVESLHDIRVADPKIADVVCPATTLAPADSFTCTGRYGPLTGAEASAGSFRNTATVTGVSDSGMPVTDDSTAVIPTYGSALLAVTKHVTGSGAPLVDADTAFTVHYSYPAGDYQPASTDAAGEPNGYPAGSGTLTVTPDGTATTSARIPGGAVVTLAEDAPETIPGADWGDASFSADPVTIGATGTTAVTLTNPIAVTPHPSIALVKSAQPDSTADYTVGRVITYSFAVTNTGNVPLTGLTVTESAFSGTGTMSAVDCPDAADPLAAGDTVTCTAEYTLTQADIDAGRLDNTAVATGTPPSGDPVTSPPSSVRIPGDPAPAISLVKSATPTSITAAGEAVDYSFTVTNTGNVTVTGVNIADTDFSGTGQLSSVDCPDAGPLAPGASTVCTAGYAATQADVDAGRITNTAVAHATAPGGAPVQSNPSSAVVAAAQHPAVSLQKTASPSDSAHFTVGSVIDYSFAVTNTGDVTLHGISVAETAFTGHGTLSAVDCPPDAALAPGATVTCTASYTLTQADIDAASVDNTATATGVPPSGTPVTSPPSSVHLPGTPQAALSLVKSASPSDAAHFTVGRHIVYSFLLTNTGAVTLRDVTVSDTGFTGSGALSAISCPPDAASLAPGQSVTCTAEYTLTQADVDAGRVDNTATATGTPPGGGTVTTPPSSVTIPGDAVAAIRLVKTADPTVLVGPGHEVRYAFAITNTGDVTLRDVGVDETAFSGSGTLSDISCPSAAAVLAPGATVICTADYTATAADAAAGQITNTATAHGTSPSGPVVSDPASARVAIIGASGVELPQITLIKSADPTTVGVLGQSVAYSYLVTNTGDVALHGVGVTEVSFTGHGRPSALVCPSTALAPGGAMVCTSSYRVTQADLDAGEVDNTATAHGTAPSGAAAVSSPSLARVVSTAALHLTLTKTADVKTIARAGDRVVYSFRIVNDGGLTASGVTIRERLFTGTGVLGPIACPATRLAVGAVETCTVGYTVTAADIAAGTLINSAVVVAHPTRTETPHDSTPSTAAVRVAVGPQVETGGHAVTRTRAGGRLAAAAGLAAAGLGLLAAALLGRRRRQERR